MLFALWVARQHGARKYMAHRQIPNTGTGRQGMVVLRAEILLLGRGIYALQCARLLQQRRRRLLLATTDRDDLAGSSSHVWQTVVLPRPDLADGPGAWRTELLRLVRTHRPALVLPVGEEGLYAAEARAACDGDWPPECLLALPQLVVLRALHHKLSFDQLLRRAGLRAPHTAAYVPGAPAPGHAVVLKPAFSRGGMRALLWRPGEPWPPPPLRDAAAAARVEEWLVQTFIDGEPLSTFAVLREGGAVAATVSYACDLCVGQV